MTTRSNSIALLTGGIIAVAVIALASRFDDGSRLLLWRSGLIGVAFVPLCVGVAEIRSGYSWKNLAPGNRGVSRIESPRRYWISVTGHIAFAAGLIVFALLFTPSSELEGTFSDLSVGVPGYEKVENFDRPADAVQGDFFSTDLIQSSNQFAAFISKLGLAQTNVLSAAGVPFVSVKSKIDPKYPWLLSVKAAPVEGTGARYRVHIEGRQPYN
jgi:hypothetical protein